MEHLKYKNINYILMFTQYNIYSIEYVISRLQRNRDRGGGDFKICSHVFLLVCLEKG